MDITKLFPGLQMLLSLAASMMYALEANWMKALYWFCAALITFSVTWDK